MHLNRPVKGQRLHKRAVFSVPWRFCNCCDFFLVFEILNFRQINSTQLSLPVPRRTADENSNHNHFIIEDSFTVQLAFSEGNCSSSIYLLAFHLCFVSKTLFLFVNYMHTCLLIILFFMTFGHSKLVRQHKCNY